MMLFVKLILAHILGDFVLQPASWVKDKEVKKIKSPKLYFHIAIHLVLLLMIVQDAIPFYTILLIAGSHLVIDLWKIYFSGTHRSPMYFWLDQLMHILVLLVAGQLYQPFLDMVIDQQSVDKILLGLTCFFLLTNVGSVVIKQSISQWTPLTPDMDSLKKAGSYIGMLERLFIFGFVLSGHLEAIGFLLAAKSVFRFGDLKESGELKLTEYILIGTFISFGWAILVAMTYILIIEMI